MTVVVAMLGLIFLIIVHELGHMLTAKALGVRVPEFGVGFGPALLKKKIGSTSYSFRIILLGGFAKMAGMGDGEEGPGTYPAQAPWRRAAIILAGPMANILAAVLIFTGLYMAGVPRATTDVAGVVPNSLAAEANIQKGDRIIAVDGRRFENWEGFVRDVGQREPGERVELVVSRDGERRTVSGELIADPENRERALVGVRPVVVEDTYGPLEALGQAFSRCVEITVTLGTFI